jgi:hypothetical protein
VIVAVGFAGGNAVAQPDPAPDDEIQLEPDPVAPAPGAPVAKDPRAAKKAHQTGLQAVAKGDAFTRRNNASEARAQYEIAEQSFRKSIELGGDATVQHDLGTALAKLGKFADAVKELRVVLKTQGARADIVKKATAKIDELSAEVGTLMLVIKPEGTSISLGGVEVGKAPLAESIVLMPGTYTSAWSSRCTLRWRMSCTGSVATLTVDSSASSALRLEVTTISCSSSGLRCSASITSFRSGVLRTNED